MNTVMNNLKTELKLRERERVFIYIAKDIRYAMIKHTRNYFYHRHNTNENKTNDEEIPYIKFFTFRYREYSF